MTDQVYAAITRDTRTTAKVASWDGSGSASDGKSGSTSRRAGSGSRRAATRSGSDRRSFASLVRDAAGEHEGQSALARWLTAQGCPTSQQNVSRWITGSVPDLPVMQQVTKLLGGDWDAVLTAAGRLRSGTLPVPVPGHLIGVFSADEVDPAVAAVAWEAAGAAFRAVLDGFTPAGKPRRAAPRRPRGAS